MKVNILGVTYTVEEKTKNEEPRLADCDGFCDKTTREIVVTKQIDSDLGDWNVYRKKIIRHEIIHAFLFESGLHENFKHADQFGHDETMIDWFAVQYVKLKTAFEEADAV